MFSRSLPHHTCKIMFLHAVQKRARKTSLFKFCSCYSLGDGREATKMNLEHNRICKSDRAPRAGKQGQLAERLYDSNRTCLQKPSCLHCNGVLHHKELCNHNPPPHFTAPTTTKQLEAHMFNTGTQDLVQPDCWMQSYSLKGFNFPLGKGRKNLHICIH